MVSQVGLKSCKDSLSVVSGIIPANTAQQDKTLQAAQVALEKQKKLDEDDHKDDGLEESRAKYKASDAASWKALINEEMGDFPDAPELTVLDLSLAIKEGSNLHKILSWTKYIQKLIKFEDLETIQQGQLGKMISQAAACLNQVPPEMRDESFEKISWQVQSTASQVLTRFSAHYFQHGNWQQGRHGLDGSDVLKPADVLALSKATNSIDPEVRGRLTWVLAEDNLRGKTWVVQSGRPWIQTRPNLVAFARAKEHWTRALPDVSFAKLLVNPITMRILYQITDDYVQTCRMTGDKDSVTHFTNFNKVRGDFNKLLVQLCSTRPNLADREKVIGTMRQFFPNALPKEKWEQVLKVCAKPEIGERDMGEVILAHRVDAQQAVAMALATTFCGEFRLALDFCRELASLTAEELSKLPLTLGERLKIVAFAPDKDGQMKPMPICLKCHELWPIYEALYSSIFFSGMDFGAIEELSRIIGDFHK